MPTNDAELRIGGNIDPLKEATTAATAEVRKMADQMQSSMNTLTGVFQKVNGAFMAFAAVLAGGSAFKSAIDASANLTKESVGLGKALGISATQASILRVALDDVYLSGDTLMMANQKVTKTLKDNEDAFVKLGVKTRDSNNDFRSSLDIMLDVNKRLLSFKEGIDRNIEGQKIYGKSWGEVAGLLKLTTERMEESKEKARALGLVVGQENVEATAKYRAAMNDVGDILMAVKKTIGDALLPVLTDLGNWFSEIGPYAVTVMKGVIGGLVGAFHGLKFAAETVWNAIAYAIEVVTIKILRFADASMHALKGDFSGAKAAWERGTQSLADVAEKRLKNIQDAAAKTREQLWNLFATPTDTKSKDDGERSKGDDTQKPSSAEKSRVSEWETELALAKVYFQKVYDLREYSKEQEVGYWKSILDNVKISGQERIAITRKVSELELEIMKKQVQQKRALDAEAITAKEKTAEDGLKLEEMLSQREYDLGNISKGQLIALQQQYEDRRFEIQQAAQESRIAAMRADPNMDPVALQKLLDQLDEIRRKHTQNATKINTDAALEVKTSWEKLLNPIGSAFGKTVTGMIQGTLTLKKGLANIFGSIFAEFTNLAVQMGVKWAAMELAKTVATQKGTAFRAVLEKMGLIETAAAQVTASGTTATAKAAEAAVVVPAEAAEAAGGAAAAVAGIPLVGPGMAAAAFAAAMAMVMGGLPSARGGFDIPAGVNPLTQLHEREMVLPAAQADAVRNMADGGGGGDTHHYHIQAWDSRDVARFLQENRRHVAGAMKSAVRDGYKA